MNILRIAGKVMRQVNQENIFGLRTMVRSNRMKARVPRLFQHGYVVATVCKQSRTADPAGPPAMTATSGDMAVNGILAMTFVPSFVPSAHPSRLFADQQHRFGAFQEYRYIISI